MVGDEADRMYGSNRLLRQEETITLTREGFTIQNAYESIQGYWAEAAQCFETESFFAVAGGTERPLLILSKESIPSQRREEVSGKMKSIFAARYRRISR